MKPILAGLLIILSLSLLSGCQAVANMIPTQTAYPTYTAYPTLTPFPTWTPIPSPTSTPTKKVDFQVDDFSSVDSCFNVDSGSGIRRSAQDGEYHISVDKPVFFGWSICNDDLRNFILDVDATPVEGPGNNSYAYGVVFRQDNNLQGMYTFLITADGYYGFSGLFQNPNGTSLDTYPLLAWAPIREVNQGKKKNHLRVTANGDEFQFFVNGVLVGLVREGTIDSGSFGFMVETFDDPGVEVAFDNLVITAP